MKPFIPLCLYLNKVTFIFRGKKMSDNVEKTVVVIGA